MTFSALRSWCLWIAVLAPGCAPAVTTSDAAADSATDIAADSPASPLDAFDADAVDADAVSSATDAPDIANTDDAPDANWLKPPCRGLMTRGGTPPVNYSWLDHAVAQVNWSDLEPSAGVFTGSGWNTIETLRRLSSHPGIRIRVLAGGNAPDWVRHLGGTPVSQPLTDAGPAIDCSSTGGIAVYNAFDGVGTCVPYFWSTAYLDAYEALMAEIARRYDADPQILEVVDSACMTTYAEVFYRAHADAETNRRLAMAGLTHAADLACQTRALTIHATHFLHTRTSLAINGWDEVNNTAPPYFQNSWPDTYHFVTASRTMMGGRLVLQNNGFDATSGTCAAAASPMSDFNCYLASIQGPKGYQTRTWARLGGTPMGLYDALTESIAQGMNFIELPDGWMGADPTRLAAFDTMLESTPCCLP